MWRRASSDQRVAKMPLLIPVHTKLCLLTYTYSEYWPWMGIFMLSMYSALMPIGALLVRREHFKLDIDHVREGQDKPTMVSEGKCEDAPPQTRGPNMIWEEGSKDAPPHTRSPRQVVLANVYIPRVLTMNGHQSEGVMFVTEHQKQCRGFL